MLIEEQALKHWIENFYGYGSWDAKVWFVSFEESGGDTPEEVAEKINHFKTLGPADGQGILCDLRELYRQAKFRGEGPKANIFSTLFDYRFGNYASLHGLWKNLFAFMEGYKGLKIENAIDYQRNFFAAPHAAEALVQLFPLPSPHNHAWYYSWLDLPAMDFIKTRAQYEATLYESRIQNILNNIHRYKPEVVLMFGMKNISELKKSVKSSFPATDFKMVKGTKLEMPQHHKADLEGTKMLITTQVPVLRHNRVESGFDWRTLGKSVRS